LQTYGAHWVVVAAGQTPLAQLAGLVCVPFAQLSATHTLVG
jgi:hypothetical protein